MSIAADLQSSLYKRHVLSIDSRSRENYTDSTPSQYIVKFPAFYRVKAVRLLTTEMPNTQYVISAKNNNLDFQERDIAGPGVATSYTAVLTPGTYTSTALADEINTRMNAAKGVGFGVHYTVTYNTQTQKFTITCLILAPAPGREFQFVFKTGPNGSDLTNTNPAVPLGFWKGFDTSTVLGVWNNGTAPATTALTSFEVVNLMGDNYAYMCITGMPTLKTTQQVGDVFAKIIWNMIPRNVVFNSFASNAIIYNEPLAILHQLEVAFRDPDGLLYEFNNVEHSFSLEIYTL